jgi:hypothetical protein
MRPSPEDIALRRENTLYKSNTTFWGTASLSGSSELREQTFLELIFKNTFLLLGARGSVVVKALCYKPEGHGFDNR